MKTKLTDIINGKYLPRRWFATLAVMAMTALLTVSCNDEEDYYPMSTDPDVSAVGTYQGRWFVDGEADVESICEVGLTGIVFDNAPMRTLVARLQPDCDTTTVSNSGTYWLNWLCLGQSKQAAYFAITTTEWSATGNNDGTPWTTWLTFAPYSSSNGASEATYSLLSDIYKLVMRVDGSALSSDGKLDYANVETAAVTLEFVTIKKLK